MTSKIVLGQELGMRLLQALGISSDGVTALAIRCVPNEAAVVEVTSTIRLENVEGVEDVLKVYSLTQADGQDANGQ